MDYTVTKGASCSLNCMKFVFGRAPLRTPLSELKTFSRPPVGWRGDNSLRSPSCTYLMFYAVKLLKVLVAEDNLQSHCAEISQERNASKLSKYLHKCLSYAENKMAYFFWPPCRSRSTERDLYTKLFISAVDWLF